MSAEITRAAIRGLKMEPDQLDAKLGECSPALRERLTAELGAIQWALAMCLVWHEQGVLDEVFDHLREACRGEAPVPAGV